MIMYKYLDSNGIDLLKNNRVLISPGHKTNDIQDFYCNLDHNYCLNSFISDILGGLKDKELVKFVKMVSGNDVSIEKLLEWARFSHEPLDQVISYFIDDYRGQLVRDIRDKIGMVSLSYRSDSSLMWAHYCRSYTGFVVGLNLELNDGFRMTKSNKIDYIERPPSVQLPWYQAQDMDDKFLFVKSLEWQYEKEFRYIFSMTENGSKSIFSTMGGRDYVGINQGEITEIVISEYTDTAILDYINSGMYKNIKIIKPKNISYELQIDDYIK